MNKKILKFGLFGIIIFLVVVFYGKLAYEKIISNTYDKPSFVPYAEQNVFTSYTWPLYTIDGDELYFKKYKGKVLMLVFVSTKSKESLYQLHSLKKIYEDYNTKMNFIFVSNDNHKMISDYFSDNNFYFPLYFYLRTPPKYFSDTIIPQTYVVSSKGRIAVDFSGPANWDDKEFRELLDGLLKK
jgi:hypothetical protein